MILWWAITSNRSISVGILVAEPSFILWIMFPLLCLVGYALVAGQAKPAQNGLHRFESVANVKRRRLQMHASGLGITLLFSAARKLSCAFYSTSNFIL